MKRNYSLFFYSILVWLGICILFSPYLYKFSDLLFPNIMNMLLLILFFYLFSLSIVFYLYSHIMETNLNIKTDNTFWFNIVFTIIALALYIIYCINLINKVYIDSLLISSYVVIGFPCLLTNFKIFICDNYFIYGTYVIQYSNIKKYEVHEVKRFRTNMKSLTIYITDMPKPINIIKKEKIINNLEELIVNVNKNVNG